MDDVQSEGVDDQDCAGNLPYALQPHHQHCLLISLPRLKLPLSICIALGHSGSSAKVPARQFTNGLVHWGGGCKIILMSSHRSQLGGIQCTMRTLESRNSSGLIAPRYILKDHQKYLKERHFFFKLSTQRKLRKFNFRESRTLNFQF